MRATGYAGCVLLYAAAAWVLGLPWSSCAGFTAAATLYLFGTALLSPRAPKLTPLSNTQLFFTLDVWAPTFVWAATGAEHSTLGLLFPTLVAVQAALGMARVLWTTHAILLAQLLALAILARGRAIDIQWASIQLGVVYVANIWLAIGVRLLRAGRDETEAALRTAQSALQQANDQAAELSRASSRAESANAAKSEFVAHVSHELRTPLNAVIGMAELLSHSQLSIEQRDQVATLRSSADTLLALIEDVLDYSKIEANQLELERRPFGLRQCLEMSIDLVAVRAAQKDLDLAYFIDVDVPETLVGDSLRLRQVLTNLLMNAVKFTESGGVGVLVSAEQVESGAYLLHVFVNDTGIGIPRDKLERLFKAFSQVDSSTTRQYGGTGLGLVICRRLVQRMGGDIWVDSCEGEGSTFHFTVRLEVPEGVVPQAAVSTWLTGKSVLVIDDGLDVSRLLSKHVRSWGGTPLLASSLLELAEWLGLDLRADLALVDLQMPEATGVLAALKKAHMPYIAMTWRGQTRLTGRGEVAIAYKPVKHDPLAEAVQRALLSPGSSTPLPEPMQPVAADASRTRVLIVDDNVVNQKVGLGMLKHIGYSAHAASHGLEAVEMMRKHPYELVLMDIFMPVMDGIVATQHIVVERGERQRPRVVAMTANALETDRQRCLQAGMDDFLTKPLRMGALENTVKRILNKAAAETPPQVSENAHDSPESVSALDEHSIANLRELDEAAGGGVFAEVVGAYLNDTKVRLRELRSALSDEQAALAERLAHTIKGSSGYLGASRVAAFAAQLEGLIKRGDFPAAQAALARLDHAWLEVAPRLEELRA